jgi:hypothetical protein
MKNTLLLAALAILSASSQAVEIPVNIAKPISSLPVTITKPGNYYFVADMYFALLASSNPNIQWAITVDAPGPVTIDMRGFTLSSPPEQGSPSYIIPGAVNILSSNVTVRDGSIRGFLGGIWAQSNTPATYLSGIDLENISFPGGTQSASIDFRFINGGLVRNCDFTQQVIGNPAINDGGSKTGNNYLNDKVNGLNMLSVNAPADFVLNVTPIVN